MTHKSKFNRRDSMKMLGLGSAAMLGMIGGIPKAEAQEKSSYAKGMPPVKIKSVKAITTSPSGSNLVVVKVETTEPGLYGLGCATFTQRAFAVLPAIEYLNEFATVKM